MQLHWSPCPKLGLGEVFPTVWTMVGESQNKGAVLEWEEQEEEVKSVLRSC